MTSLDVARVATEELLRQLRAGQLSDQVSPQDKARAEHATVRLTSKGGHGVLVPGGYILTATHCLNWDGHGGMALGDPYIEPVLTRSGAPFRVSVVACDPVSDIAVLGQLDDQMFSEADQFPAWSQQVEPVPLSKRQFETWESCPVTVLAHNGQWLAGVAVTYSLDKTGVVCLETRESVEGGASGGPVIDPDGTLIGVISNAGGASGEPATLGLMPVPSLALPNWLLTRIEAD